MADVVAEGSDASDVHFVDVQELLQSGADAPHEVEDLADREAVGEVVVGVDAVSSGDLVDEHSDGVSADFVRSDAIEELESFGHEFVRSDAEDVEVDVEQVEVFGVGRFYFQLLQDINYWRAGVLALAEESICGSLVLFIGVLDFDLQFGDRVHKRSDQALVRSDVFDRSEESNDIRELGFEEVQVLLLARSDLRICIQDLLDLLHLSFIWHYLLVEASLEGFGSGCFLHGILIRLTASLISSIEIPAR